MKFAKASNCIYLLLTLVVLLGCRPVSSTPTEVGVAAELSNVAKELTSHGYRVSKCLAVRPTSWEATKFRMRSKQITSFRAEKRLPNETENYYVRFSLAEETYDTTQDARNRLAQLHQQFSDGPWEDDYTRTLRDGFQIDRTAYILQTDAAIFWPEIKRLTKLLVESTKGAQRVPTER